MSDRKRRVTFKLDAEQHRELQALATLKHLPLEEVAAGAVKFHVSKCMTAIQSRPFPELLIDVTRDGPEVVIPHGYLTEQVPGDNHTGKEKSSELPEMELFGKEG